MEGNDMFTSQGLAPQVVCKYRLHASILISGNLCLEYSKRCCMWLL